MTREKIVIAGPCALESREQLKECIQVLQKMGIHMVRAPLWKPRTKPGWEGLGWMSLPVLLEETIPVGMTPAIELLTREHALFAVQALEQYGKDGKMFVWIGSRNQNHIEQQKIAEIIASSSSDITFMFKNQMWDDEKHWLGIYEHILAGGLPKERLISCHRGFSPGKMPNPQGFRNIPDFEMAMRIKEQTGIKMLLDPSHIGGTRKNVLEICHSSLPYAFDGYLIEMHVRPEQAKTDKEQQLTPDELSVVLEMVG